MNRYDDIDAVIQAAADGSMSVDAACAQARGILDRSSGYVDLGFARADVSRADRQGVGEVVFGEGKSAAEISSIAAALVGAGQTGVLVTRCNEEKAEELDGLWQAERLSRPSCASAAFTYVREAHIGWIGEAAPKGGNGTIVVACAGTSDVAVAQEAAYTAEFFGNKVVRLFDVGVSGIHRLMAHADELSSAQVVIAVAGMEGALASVIGGIVSCPVIAVPTSVGYGASFGGVSALLAMLNSCASGVTVVNIDNGFGAAYQASLINHLSSSGLHGEEA